LILKGYKLARRIIADLGSRVPPTQELAVIQIGDNPVSDLYISKKREMASELGINFRLLRFDESITEAELIKQIDDLNDNPVVRGILIQMPLPQHIEKLKIAEEISLKKDVDGFGYIMRESGFKTFPPTVLAIDEILDFYHIKKENKKILIVGGGFLIGAPLEVFWKNKNFKPQILKANDENYEERLKQSDIVVVATGGGRVFNAEDFKSSATVIDASTVSDSGKIKGDVNLDNWPDDISLVPVPGGVGPVTVAMLFRNFFDL